MNAGLRSVTLSLEAVAQRLERHLETVEEWAATGQLITVRLIDGEDRVPSMALWPRRQVSESDE